MKRFTYLSIIFFVFAVAAGCTSSEKHVEDPENWTEAQVNEWFEGKEWLGETQMQPDPSIDKKEFAVQYHRNKKRWDAAFAFLKKENLSAIEAGNHALDGKHVFVKVTEYDSKNPEDVFYESHKNYADIQFVISGEEYIGRTDLTETTTVKTPYNAEKDIQFYHVSNGRKLLAKPGTFFIFFPRDAHCPGIKVEDYNTPVKKMVIKVMN